ncbi:MAG: aquaporin family protein [Planctomycetes bacterium]|nr:aquaporin family protein [Planctomycetota bacterium]
MRALAAEFLATGLLLAVVVGSGIMGDRLSGGNVAVALLANSLATGAGLVALILTFGPASGAHLNPVVTLAAAATGGIGWRQVPGYVTAQIAGGFGGVVLAHAMFGLPAFVASAHERSGFAQALAEAVATACLVLVVLSCGRHRPTATPFAVAAMVCAGYWFTSSTSFANPAVTLARAATDTFAGIRAVDVPAFVGAQLVGAAAAVLVFRWLLVPGERR